MEHTPRDENEPSAGVGYPMEPVSDRDLTDDTVIDGFEGQEEHEKLDLTYNIVNGIAEQTDADPCKLPPLYEIIDPEALDAFLRCSDNSDTRPTRSIAFSYCGYRVTADSTGQVKLSPEPKYSVK